jgi:hypothetical protein
VNELTLIPLHRALIAHPLGGGGDDSYRAQLPAARAALAAVIPDFSIALVVENEVLDGTVAGAGEGQG